MFNNRGLIPRKKAISRWISVNFIETFLSPFSKCVLAFDQAEAVARLEEG